MKTINTNNELAFNIGIGFFLSEKIKNILFNHVVTERTPLAHTALIARPSKTASPLFLFSYSNKHEVIA